ncbi:hypothetical protein HPB50_006695 [Hyalomma asiaticum]|uniref:Uncharacterized protein n=1 Tax=Hyalomma asiaticum TaxID=266040 RepID=A0ACB7TDG9_HYAAI|nr:hypothetical protein HPB50_006695 [Hyalomma asiaticum]
MQDAPPIAGKSPGGSPRRPGLPAWPPPPAGPSPARGSSPGRLRTPSPLRPPADLLSGLPPRPPGTQGTPSPRLRAPSPAVAQPQPGSSPARAPVPVSLNIPPPPKPDASPSAGTPTVAPLAVPLAAEAAPQVVPTAEPVLPSLASGHDAALGAVVPPSATAVPAAEPVLPPEPRPDGAPGVPPGAASTPPRGPLQVPAPAPTTSAPAEGENAVPALSADSGVSPSASGASAASGGTKAGETRGNNGLDGDGLILNKLTEIQDMLAKNTGGAAEGAQAGIDMRGRNNKVAFSIAAQSLPFIQTAERLNDAQFGGPQRSGNTVGPSITFAYAPSPISNQNVPRSETRDEIPVRFAFAPIYTSQPGNNPRPPVIATAVPLTFAYGPTLSSLGHGAAQPSRQMEGHQGPQVQGAAAANLAASGMARDIPLAFAYAPATAIGRSNPINFQSVGNDVPLTFAYGPSMSFAQRENNGLQGATGTSPLGINIPHVNSVNEARRNELPMTFAYAPASPAQNNAATLPTVAPTQIPPPRYRFAFGPPFSDLRDASRNFWSSPCAETPTTQAQSPPHSPPATVTIPTAPDPPMVPSSGKPAEEKRSHTTPPAPPLSREKVYIEEVEEHDSTEESYKGRRRFIRDRRFKHTDEEDDDDNDDEDSEDEEEDEEAEDEDYDYNLFKERASRNRRRSLERKLPPKAARRQPTTAPPMMARHLEPHSPTGMYPAPYYMPHQAQPPMANFYQPAPPTGATFCPPDAYQPPAPMMQSPPPTSAYPQEQPRAWTNRQQWPQATSAPPESSFPEIGIVRREERIEYECASGQTCQLRADNCTTVSADSGVSRTLAQEHGDGRVPCMPRHAAKSQVTTPSKPVKENGKRLQLTPNVALKIARDVEENNVAASQGDKRKEVEIKITEQVLIAMKDDDERDTVEENSVESCAHMKVQTPTIVAEARSEVELQADDRSMLVVQKGDSKSQIKKTRRSRPVKRTKSRGTSCCRTLSPCFQSLCQSKPANAGQEQPSLFSWLMSSCGMQVPTESSESSDTSESSEVSHELPEKQKESLSPVKRKRRQDPRLQRLIKLERLLREKMAKNPELRKLLSEEVFMTKDEAARMQERQEREAAAAAVQQRDEAAQTIDAAQADINRLLQLEAELKAELAKLQSALKEPLSSRAMVEDGREKLKSIGEATFFDRTVFEKPKKERVATRDFAVGVHYDIMESPDTPSPEPGWQSMLSRPQIFNICEAKGTQASLVVESSSISDEVSEQGLYFVGSRKKKDGGVEILLSTQHKRESSRGDRAATTLHRSTSLIRSYNEQSDKEGREHPSRPKRKRQKTGSSRARTPDRHALLFKDKASQTIEAKTEKKVTRVTAKDRKGEAHTEVSFSTEESSDMQKFTYARKERSGISKSKRVRDESSDSSSFNEDSESGLNSPWPPLSSVKITTRPSARVRIFNKSSRRSSRAPMSSKISNRLPSTRATTRSSSRAVTTISSSSNASSLLQRRHSRSAKPTSRCSYYENTRASRSMSPLQSVRQSRCTWQQPNNESSRRKQSYSTVLQVHTAQIAPDQVSTICPRHLREIQRTALEPHLLERDEKSRVQTQNWDNPSQWFDKAKSARAQLDTPEQGGKVQDMKLWKDQVLFCYPQNNDTGQGDLPAAVDSMLTQVPDRQAAAAVNRPLFVPEHMAEPGLIETVESKRPLEPTKPIDVKANQENEPKQKTETTISITTSRTTGNSSYGTPALSIASYSSLKPREQRIKRMRDPHLRRSRADAVVYFLLSLAALLCILAVVDLFEGKDKNVGHVVATKKTVSTAITTRKHASALQRSHRGVSPCHDFYSSACFTPASRVATDVAVVRRLENTLLQQQDSPLRPLLEECVNASSQPDAWAQFRQLLTTVSLEGWPFSKTSPARPPAAVWEAAALLLRLFGLPALASLSIRDHPSHQGKFIVALEPPQLLINASAAAHNWSVLWHTRAAGSVLSAFGLDESGAASDVTAMERRLAVLAQPPPTETSGLVDNMTVLFRLRHFVAQALNRLVHVSDSTELWLPHPPYVQGLLRLLDESSPQTPLNYLGFRLLVRVAPFLPAAPGGVTSLLALHLAHGRPLELDAAHACLRLTTQAQPHLALLAVYKGGRELYDRLQRLDFAGRLRVAVEKRLLRSAGILDATTRAQALRRLRRLQVRAFFPDWVRAPPNEQPLSSHGLAAFVEASSRMTALRQGVRPEARWMGSPLDGHCSLGSRTLYVPASLAEPSLARLSSRASACLMRVLLLNTPPSVFQHCFPSADVFVDAAALPVAWELFQALHRSTPRNASADDIFFTHFSADLCQWRSRVILPLSSSSEFRSAFNCSGDDAMAKLSGCGVWGS